MKPLFPIVVAILVVAANAHPEHTEEVKELAKSKEPVVEAEPSDPQERKERCTACAGTLSLKTHQNALAALKNLPNAEVHTQQSFEGCSSDKGCAGVQLKDGKLVKKFGNLDAFNAAAAANSGGEFQFHPASVFEGKVGAGGPFWWMNENSPFKNTGAAGSGHSEKFSKFQSSSFTSSSNGGAGGLDLAANPFLNGEFSKLSGGFTSGGANFAGQGFEAAGAGASQGAGFGAGFGGSQGAGFGAAQGAGFSAGQGAGFGAAQGAGFAGQGGSFGSGSQSSFGSNSQSSFAGAQNGFGGQSLAGQGLAGQGAGLGGGQSNFNSFNSASKFASTGYTGSSPAPFASTGSNVNLIQNSQKSDYDFEQQQQTQQNIDELFQATGNVQAHENTGGDLQQTCSGQGYICVHKAQCNNGVVNTNGGSLLQANTQKQYCNTRTEVCCRLETSSLGPVNQGSLGVDSATFSGSSSQGSGLFSQSGSNQNSFGASTGFGSGQSTSNTGFSANRGTTASGFGSNTNQFTGSGTQSQFGSSFGSNTNKFAGSTVGTGFGSTLAPTPNRFNNNNFNNEVFKSTSQSNFVETDSFSSGSENNGVFRPSSGPGIPYLPPVDASTSGSNVISSTAFVTTPRPFTTPRPVSPPRPFTTPRPTYLPPVSSTSAPGYLPPIEQSGSESIRKDNRVPIDKDGSLYLDETIQPPIQRVPINTDVPSGCAAALKCTPIEFCTAEGVISNTTVVLTRDQDAYRVPLTDCKDLETGRIGKCCRDPFYTDPWPVNQLGKWNSNIFGDGKYVPDSRGSPNNPRPVVTARPPVSPVTGGVLLNTNSFGPTPKPILPQGPNQVTPGFPSSTPPTSFVQKNQFGQGSYSNTGRGQFGVGGQGQYGQGSSFSQTSQSFGQGSNQGQGSFGQGVQTSQGSGFAVNQGAGQVIRQGAGVGINRGQGFGVTQGVGQTVSQERGTAVTQGFGTRQDQGTAVIQGQGFGVQRGQGVGVTQGSGFAVSQGGGIGVSQGQGSGVRQGQGFAVTQGQGQYGSQGQFGVGQGTRVGEGFAVTQGAGSLVSRGQGTAVSQGSGFRVNQGGGSAVSQGAGFGLTQGGGSAVSQGAGFGVTQGGGAVSQGAGFGVQQGGGFGVQQGGGSFIRQGQGTGIRQGTGFGVTQGGGLGFGFGQGQTLLQGQGQALVQGQGEEVSQTVQRVFLTRYSGSGQCGVLNPQKPYGNRKDLEVDFAEIPWQAMVLLQTNRSLLCGGVITRPDVVITSASCVEGLEAKNVLIKGGEWKLGIDEEPLPFQIVQVKHILRHPFYKAGSLKNDAAILVLSENLRLAKNIWPICLPSAEETLDAYYNGAGECIVTGWGKTVLQAHLLGSVMHGLNVSLINPGSCQSKLKSDYPHLLDNYEQDSCVCGQPTNPANNICKVDTGSALACTTGDGHYVLRGVYSWESGCQVGNQLAAFYKFDLEWYEWAIGLIESVRFSQFTTTKVTKVTGSTYTTGTKGVITGVKGQTSGVKGFGVKGQGIQGIQGFGIQGQAGQGLQGFGKQSQTGEFSQFGTTKFTGSSGKFSAESGENAGLNFGSEINGPLSKTFSATFTEKKFFQTEPKYVTYTTKPEIVTFTTKPEFYTFTTKPKYVTYTTKPEIVTYTTKPEIVTYTTKPEFVTYTTKPQIIRYETSGTVTNPKYVSPGLSFSEVVGAKHTHSAQCKCLENGKK
ncbi:uncharacterized protein LOC142984921 [Anticarsia gemmatalis]|uniref:uncharacterized protein LOC142984921 n=1 Tax=Anticarsia gemmatalis TaxID=129554 RepID=UPI003F774E58